MLTVTKDYRFEAAHSLPHLPEDHKCHRLHGHSYRFTVECTGQVDPDTGFIIEYSEISKHVKPILKRLDHHNLDDVLPGMSTAENLAQWIYNELSQPLGGLLSGIIVYETSTTSVVAR